MEGNEEATVSQVVSPYLGGDSVAQVRSGSIADFEMRIGGCFRKSASGRELGENESRPTA